MMLKTVRRLLFFRAAYYALVIGLLVIALWPRQAAALQLGSRSLEVGSTVAGETTQHTFRFTYASTTAVGSVLLEYCDSPLPDVACTPPPGVDVSGVSLVQQFGEVNFGILTTSSNSIILSRPPTATGNIPSTYVFDNAINMTGPPNSYYARISTYPTLNASGAFTDFGGVVTATTVQIGITTEVPPILIFCVAQSIPTDCSSADGNIVDLGTLSTTVANRGTSQMIVGTNALFGMVITMLGTTLTSGNNTIPALAVQTPSAPGNSQFGVNLRANSDPVVGLDPSGTGVVQPTGPYNIPNRFRFNNGDVVASTGFTTNNTKLTVSYVANISPVQTAGVYTATLTYICTATF